MKINEPTFTGINIANVADRNIKVYRITKKDCEFLELLSKDFDAKQLMPHLDKDSVDVYNSMVKSSTKAAKRPSKQAMLLTYNDKPCGIMVNSEDGQFKQHIDYLCTWQPKGEEKKAPFGAQTLFLQMFKDFLNTQAKTIELNAIRYGNAISKYISLGFKPVGGNGYTETMRISRADIESKMSALTEKIHLKSTNTEKDEDLVNRLIF